MNDSQLNTGEVRVASGDAWTEVRIDPLNGHRSLFSKRAFQPGEVISPFYWDHIQETPTYLTVQIGTGQHVELLPAHLECVNHSCSPAHSHTHSCLHPPP
mgnify:CR=1 FL=1